MPMYSNGIGESTGDTLATCEPLYTSGDIWYVKSSTGVDAASPRGRDATRPLATIAQAHTNAANDDIIVLLDGHTETVSALTISKNVIIVGSGSSSGLPTAKLTPAAADAIVFTVTAAGVQFRNVWFEERTASSTYPVISVEAANFQMVGCYCQLGAYDAATVYFESGGDDARLVNTTFVSTATALTAQPTCAVRIDNDISDLDLDGVVFDGGAYGFALPGAFDGTTAANSTITRLRAQSISLLRGADMSIKGASTGWVNTQTVTGSSRLVWTGV